MSSLATRRILVVDDSAAVRATLEALLEPYGFDVEHAEDGSTGLRRVGGGRWDLVLLDLHMPVLDGPTMLRYLRQWGNGTPVVLVTSASDTKLLASLLKLGRVDYVCKPFDPRQLHAALARALGVPPEALVAEAPRALVVERDGGTAELLRGAAPPHVTVDVAATPEAAEALARQQAYQLVLVDGVSLGRDAADGIGRRLRALQPEAAHFVLDDPERTGDARRRSAAGPFDGAVPSPPDARVVREFLYPGCLRNLVAVSGDTVALAPFRGLQEDADVYFELAARRLLAAVRTLGKPAAALRVDLSRAPPVAARLGRLVALVREEVAGSGAGPVFVVAGEARAALQAGGEPWAASLVTPGSPRA